MRHWLVDGGRCRLSPLRPVSAWRGPIVPRPSLSLRPYRLTSLVHFLNMLRSRGSFIRGRCPFCVAFACRLSLSLAHYHVLCCAFGFLSVFPILSLSSGLILAARSSAFVRLLRPMCPFLAAFSSTRRFSILPGVSFEVICFILSVPAVWHKMNSSPRHAFRSHACVLGASRTKSQSSLIYVGKVFLFTMLVRMCPELSNLPKKRRCGAHESLVDAGHLSLN